MDSHALLADQAFQDHLHQDWFQLQISETELRLSPIPYSSTYSYFQIS